MHHLIGPLNIIDQSYCTTHSFSRTCFTVNLTETARYETLRSLERRKKGKWLSSLSSNTSGSAPDTAITDNHETDPREKGRDMTQSYDNLTTQKRHQKLWLYTTLDTGRSVGVMTITHWTGVVKPVYRIPTFPPKRIKSKTKRIFSAAVYHDLPVSSIVLISVANFKIYS